MQPPSNDSPQPPRRRVKSLNPFLEGLTGTSRQGAPKSGPAHDERQASRDQALVVPVLRLLNTLDSTPISRLPSMIRAIDPSLSVPRAEQVVERLVRLGFITVDKETARVTGPGREMLTMSECPDERA